MFLLHLSIAEYPTEDELLRSLQDGTVDKIWMFDCQAKYKKISPDFDFTIVSVLDDEFTWGPTVGVRVQFLDSSYFHQNFTECLKMVQENVTDNNYHDHDNDWKQDVRKHSIILLTALHFLCDLLSHLLSPNNISA